MKCEVILLPSKLSINDAIRRAMKITEEEKREVAFDFYPNLLNRSTPTIDKMYMGNCSRISPPEGGWEDKGGHFHTHYLNETIYHCVFSGDDISSGIGRVNILGCYRPQEAKKKWLPDDFEFKKVDLRLRSKKDRDIFVKLLTFTNDWSTKDLVYRDLKEIKEGVKDIDNAIIDYRFGASLSRGEADTTLKENFNYDLVGVF